MLVTIKFASLLAVALTVGLDTVQANCKTSDAHWKPGTLRVSQPDRANPRKVNLSWKHILLNAECVDKYTIFLWHESDPSERHAQKVVLKNVRARPTTDHTLALEACVSYKFKVQLFEDDFFGGDSLESTQAVSFKTEAVPRLENNSQNNFKVGYFFDPVKQVHDLSKASIKFPKNLITNANCIKHIQVSGVENLAGSSETFSQSSSGSGLYSRRSGGSGLYPGASSGGSGSYPGSTGAWGGSGSYPGSSGGSGSYPGASSGSGTGSYPGSSGGWGGSGSYPGSSGGSGSYPGTPGGSGSYPRSSQHRGGSGSYPGISGGSGSYPGSSGGSGSYPGNTGSLGGSGSYPGNFGGSGSYPGSSGGSGSYPGNYGGSGSYPGSYGGSGSYPVSGSYHGSSGCSSAHAGHNDGCGGNWHGREEYGSRRPPYYPSGGRGKRASEEIRGRTPAAAAAAAVQKMRKIRAARPAPRRSRPTARPRPPVARPPVTTANLTAVAAPPFTHDFIEVVVSVKSCSSYKFTLKVVSAHGASLGEVRNLVLPRLSQIQDFHPAPMNKVLRVTPSKQIVIQPDSGVPIECLSEFLRSVDFHMIRLEDEVAFHANQQFNAERRNQFLIKERSRQQSLYLRTFLNCACESPFVNISSVDAKAIRKYKASMGVYEYVGVHAGKAYFQSPPLTANVYGRSFASAHVKPLAQTNSSLHGGHGHDHRKRSIHETSTTVPSPTAKFLLFWHSTSKAWWVASKLTDRQPLLKTKKNSRAACPADPEAERSWQYSTTLKWKDDPTMNASCLER